LFSTGWCPAKTSESAVNQSTWNGQTQGWDKPTWGEQLLSMDVFTVISNIKNVKFGTHEADLNERFYLKGLVWYYM
jgi:hypothetical protein